MAPRESSRQEGRPRHGVRRTPPSTKSTATMAREQPSMGDLLPLLETSDLHQLEEIRGLINEQLSTGIVITSLKKKQQLYLLVCVCQNVSWLCQYICRTRVCAAQRAGGLLFRNKLIRGHAYPLLSQRAARQGDKSRIFIHAASFELGGSYFNM